MDVSAAECSGSTPRPSESAEVQGGAATSRDPVMVLEGTASAIGRRDRPSGHSREALWRSPGRTKSKRQVLCVCLFSMCDTVCNMQRISSIDHSPSKPGQEQDVSTPMTWELLQRPDELRGTDLGRVKADDQQLELAGR